MFYVIRTYQTPRLCTCRAVCLSLVPKGKLLSVLDRKLFKLHGVSYAKGVQDYAMCFPTLTPCTYRLEAIFERWSATLGGQLGLVLVHLGYAMCQISPPFFGAVTHSQWVKFKEDLNAWGTFIESKDKSRKVSMLCFDVWRT